MATKLPDAFALADTQAAWIQSWHAPDGVLRPEVEAMPDNDDTFLDRVEAQARRNVLLWAQEDLARDPKADDATIATVKRRIDNLNQARNDRIEQLDEALAAMLYPEGLPTLDRDADERDAGGAIREANAPRWNTETPGSAIDRLAIMALKVFHMGVQANRADVDEAHREASARKQTTLMQQRRDLTQALAWLLEDLAAGRKALKLNRQYKMYNDPTMNPVFYRKPS